MEKVDNKYRDKTDGGICIDRQTLSNYMYYDDSDNDNGNHDYCYLHSSMSKLNIEMIMDTKRQIFGVFCVVHGILNLKYIACTAFTCVVHFSASIAAPSTFHYIKQQMCE